jgi:transcriptional regulator with XRE-family HTH domain
MPIVSGSRRLAKMRSKAYRESMVESNATLRVATQVRLLREQAKLSQAQLAHAIGTRQSAIARIESGQYGRFSIAVLHRIAKHFDVATWVEFISFSTLLQRTADVSPDAITPKPYTEEFGEDGEPSKRAAILNPSP